MSEYFDGFRLEIDPEMVVFFRIDRDEVTDEQCNVIGAFAQGRHAQGDDIQPEEEIFAELPLMYHLAQIAIGGSDDPGAGAEQFSAADAPEPFVL